jgi:hypothetical protein
MARVDGTSLDEEALAVAMLLHDIGLFAAAQRLESVDEFTVRGARIASRMLLDLGWPSSRVDLVAQAITVNPNARVGRARWGPEAYFGRLAPVCDGLGQTWRIPEGVARAIAARHPYEGFGDAVRRLVSGDGADGREALGALRVSSAYLATSGAAATCSIALAHDMNQGWLISDEELKKLGVVVSAGSPSRRSTQLLTQDDSQWLLRWTTGRAAAPAAVCRARRSLRWFAEVADGGNRRTGP